MSNSTPWPQRQAQLASLQRQPVDLLVIGGGVVGTGIAWEAALRGLTVAVLDKGDFASGTSSKSSKLLHGGLRYLENFEFGLVFESLAQRNHLFEDAPHVAQRLDFLFPVFKGGLDKGWKLGAGLFFYDALAALSRPKQAMWHERLSKLRAAAAEPNLRQDTLREAYRYTDGLTEDARLVIETMKSAVDAGATVLNHVAVTGFLKDAQGQITGVQAQDLLSNEAHDLPARQVFNATGPWADALCRLDDPTAKARLRPTKGVHILVDGLVHEHAVVLRTSWPGESSPRVMFVVPWQGRTLIGTTDTDHQGAPDDLAYLDDDLDASPEEVAYLLASVNACFGKQLGPSDVLSAYAGWRPLIAPPEAGLSASKVSREHEVYSSAAGLITIAGGKLTAYRAMAREGVEAVVKALQPPHLKPSQIERATLSGSELGGLDLASYVSQQVAAFASLPAELVKALAMRHGSHWPRLAELLAADPTLALELARPLPTGPAHYAVEAVYAVEHEAAVTLADFMLRRTRLYLLMADQGLAAAALVAPVMARALQQRAGWDDAQRDHWAATELASYAAQVARARAKRGQPEPARG